MGEGECQKIKEPSKVFNVQTSTMKVKNSVFSHPRFKAYLLFKGVLPAK